MPDARPRRSPRRGWLALVLAAVAVSAALAVDAHLKRAPHAGFVLPGSDLVVTAADLPRAWRTFEDSPAFDRVQSSAPQLYQRLGVRMRIETGVRWTPVRWYLWFGRPVSFSARGTDWVASCRPGILLRLARRTGALGPSASRDGFLILGTSDTIVQDLLAHGVPAETTPDPATVHVRWAREPAGEMTLGFSAEWHARGALELSAAVGSDATPRRMDDWPDDPMLSLFVARRDLLDDVLPDKWPAFPMRDSLKEAWDEFLNHLPDAWDQGADSLQFGLQSVDARDVIPIADIAVIARAATPFSPLIAPANAIPYQWGSADGWMAPWLGEPVSLYAAQSGRTRVFANQDAAMARVLRGPLPGRIVSHDAVLDADLSTIASTAAALTRTAAREELLPAYDADDAESEFVPWFDALGALGSLHVEGRVIGDRLEFVGTLVPPVEDIVP